MSSQPKISTERATLCCSDQLRWGWGERKYILKWIFFSHLWPTIYSSSRVVIASIRKPIQRKTNNWKYFFWISFLQQSHRGLNFCEQSADFRWYSLFHTFRICRQFSANFNEKSVEIVKHSVPGFTSKDRRVFYLSDPIFWPKTFSENFRTHFFASKMAKKTSLFSPLRLILKFKFEYYA